MFSHLKFISNNDVTGSKRDCDDLLMYKNCNFSYIQSNYIVLWKTNQDLIHCNIYEMNALVKTKIKYDAHIEQNELYSPNYGFMIASQTELGPIPLSYRKKAFESLGKDIQPSIGGYRLSSEKLKTNNKEMTQENKIHKRYQQNTYTTNACCIKLFRSG